MAQPIQSASKPNRDQLLAAITLAFKYSKLSKVGGTPYFANTLDEQWESIVVSGDVMKMQVIYDLLRNENGFVAADAVAPMARIKTWEPYFKLRLDLPKELTTLGGFDAVANARTCVVPDGELAVTLPSAAPAMNLNSAVRLQAVKSMTNMQVIQPPPEKVKPKTAMYAVAGTVALLVALGGGGVAFVKLRVTPVDVAQVSDEIPLVSASRRGSVIKAVLRDRLWTSFPKEDRKAQVLAAFLKLTGLSGVTELQIVDKDGNVMVVARNTKPNPTVEVLE